jgi:hypothetical protein
METTYWNHQGKYQAQYDELVNLMPAMGKSDTVAGELIRAVSKLGYDFYNNGMGNNTSGALNFIGQYPILDQKDFDTIYEYTRGRIYNGNYDGDSLQVALEGMVDKTVEFITRNLQLVTMANSVDMLDLGEPDEYYDDEEDYYYGEEETY